MTSADSLTSFVVRVSSGKNIFLSPIPAASTLNCFGILRTSCCCAHSSPFQSLLCNSCSSVQTFAVSLPSVLRLRVTTLRLATLRVVNPRDGTSTLHFFSQISAPTGNLKHTPSFAFPKFYLQIPVLNRASLSVRFCSCRAHTRVLRQAGGSCFYDSEVLNSSFVHLMKFIA